MSRISEIDKFLRNISEYLKQNPDFELKEKYIYEMLKKYELNDEEYKTSFKDYFSYWEEYFKSKKNITVFNHNDQKRFLQFWNKNEDDNDYIKIYVSVKPESMLKSVSDIFTFTEKNNITQCSKVADKARSDSIVLRVKEKDAKKVIDFINENKYIKENAKKTNPFVFREGVAGVAYDDNLSYNATVSFIITEYFKFKKSNNDLESASYIDFYKYVYDYSKKLRLDEKFIEEFENSEHFKSEYSRLSEYGITKEQVLDNSRKVIDLIGFSLNENKNYEDLVDLYKSDKVEAKKEDSIDCKKLLDSYLDIALSKYKTKEGIMEYLQSYLDGNLKAITRTNNFRELFQRNLPPSKIDQIANGDIAKYVEDHLKRHDNYLIFTNSCLATYQKYGISQLIFALKNATRGNYSSFTNDNGLRTLMIEKLKREDINECINKTILSSNVDLDDNYLVSCAKAIEEMIKEEESSKQL